VRRIARRRLLALTIPLPILGAGAAALKATGLCTALRLAITFPTVGAWYLLTTVGMKSFAVAAAIGAGYWYLLLSLGAYAMLCGRDRVSKGLLICVLATTAVVLATVWMLRGASID
jgi:hypothetical protein